MQDKKINIQIMAELSKKRSFRDAIKWLDTDTPNGKTPAQLMKNGQSAQALKFLKLKKLG